MMKPTHHPAALTLGLPARTSYLHVATHFAESSAAAYGLGKDDRLKLGLAVEEIFMHLCTAVCPEQPLEIRSEDGVYYACIQFRFAAARLDMRGLNIATSVACDPDSDLDEMGLMLASRSVDHLHIAVEKDNRICLSIAKEKSYPEASLQAETGGRAGAGRAAPGKDISVEIPGPEHLKLMAAAVSSGSLPFVPPFFRYPGKVVDMVGSGEYRAVAALNGRREIIGGALLRSRSEKIVEIYGPYLFGPGDGAEAARLLLDDCIGRIARTKALGLLSLSGLPVGVRENFESLGSLDFFTKGGPKVERPSLYRHLHEDPGCEAWTHGDLVPWLRGEYERLVLARDIRTVKPMGETRSGASLFAADIDREISEAVLRPVWPGDDLDANVQRHVSFLRNEAFLNVFFELDLGTPWHSELMPVLAAQGFRPRLLLPFAGKSDMVIYQYDAT